MLWSSNSFESLAEATGFPVDQINFIAGMAVSLLFAVLYNLFLPPQKHSRDTRLLLGLLGGIVISWSCYSSTGFFQLLIMPTLCYSLLFVVPPEDVHKYTFILALTWLSCNHIYRQVTDYGGYKLDITGPLMLMVEKVTYVAYALHDGLGRDPSEMTEEQKAHSIKKRPTILEYFSYLLHFKTILSGPTGSYFEYMEFIEGADVAKYTTVKGFKQFPLKIVIQKSILAFVFLAGHFLFTPAIPVETCVDPIFLSNTWLITKIVYAYGVIQATKLKYYFAWTFADAINNAAGMGFNGYDDNGNELWDRYTGCNIVNIELATNTRMIITNWHIPTARWLKRTVYDRAKSYRVLSTFVVSAFWHGFYPGYYLCFVSVGLITLSTRTTRRSFRPFFQETRRKKIFYDVLTWFVTMMFVGYLCVVFVMLHFEEAFIFWRSMYFCGHILILAGFASPWISSWLNMKRPSVINATEVNEVANATKNNFNQKHKKTE